MTTFYADKDQRTIDFDITLTAVSKVTFGDEKDGVLGIRMRPILQEDKGTGHITNADGLKARRRSGASLRTGATTRARSRARRSGSRSSIIRRIRAIPVRWHARGYGLFAANPFGQKVFDKDPAGWPMTLEPGKSLRFRYRIIIHPGDVKSADIAGQWAKYARRFAE